MEYIKAIILGLIQGFTEFLPVSSSGHLVLFGYFMGFEQELSFEVFVHLGTLIAVLIYFRKDLFDLVKSIIYFKDASYNDGRKMILWLFIATVVTGIIGIVCKDLFKILFDSPLFVACMLAVTGTILYFSDKIGAMRTNHAELNVKKSLFIGLGQAIAITPGISRSGTTIVFALLAGLKREHAARFSFLLSIPAILGAALLDYRAAERLDSAQLIIYIIGFVTAFISGYFVIKWFMKLIVRAKLRYFAYYCWTIAVVSIILILVIRT